jgi:hypothetical protein
MWPVVQVNEVEAVIPGRRQRKDPGQIWGWGLGSLKLLNSVF